MHIPRLDEVAGRFSFRSSKRVRYYATTEVMTNYNQMEMSHDKDGSDTKEGATALKMHHITRAEANASELRQEKRIEVEKLKDNIL